jgi:hypothetical protein
VIQHPAYPVEPWCLRETELDLDVLAQSESLFALSNGHIGWRGNLDEGEPYGLPGSYLNGVYESRPLPYAEAGYGYPEAGQTVINVTNAKLIRLLVDDQPFDVRTASSAPMSDRSTSTRASWSATSSGCRRAVVASGCARRAWCRWSSARWPPSPTRSNRSTRHCGWWSSPNWWRTRSSRSRRGPTGVGRARGAVALGVPRIQRCPGQPSCTPRPGAACGSPWPWTTASRVRLRCRCRPRASPTSGG